MEQKLFQKKLAKLYRENGNTLPEHLVLRKNQTAHQEGEHSKCQYSAVILQEGFSGDHKKSLNSWLSRPILVLNHNSESAS